MSKHNAHSIERYRVPASGRKFRLDQIDPGDRGGLTKERAAELLERDIVALNDLQEKLVAATSHAVLVVLQAMDTGGKDGTVRRVFGPLDSLGLEVTSFKKPTPEELSHDFLWRVHRACPAKGKIGIFNRSHYEDVLVVRVHKWADPDTIRARYDQIRDFEKLLAANNTKVVKIFLHISRDEQRKRLQERLDDPTKHWKFNVGDLAERALWDDYMNAYELALSKCSTDDAPWYVIPANHKWYRNHLVARILRKTVEDLNLAYPVGAPGLKKIKISK
jgi:PPK2 family polyphosphate:nucleotide phosphotransferase